MPQTRRGPDFGNSVSGPLRTRRPFGLASQRGIPASNNFQFEDEVLGWNPRTRCDVFDDFILGPHVFGATQGAVTNLTAFAARKTTTAGTPTILATDDAPNGVIQALLASNSEVEVAGIDWTDNLAVPMTRAWMMSAYVRIPVAITTAQDVIIGMVSAYNSTLASMSRYAWFRLSASMALKAEATDGTTTTLAQDLAYTFPTNSFVLLTVLARATTERNTGFVEFWVEDSFMGKINIAAAAVTDVLQPLLAVRKSTGATTPALDIDFARASWNRI